MADNTNERKVSPLDQLEEEDFYFFIALFDEFTADEEAIRTYYNPLKEKFTEVHKGILKDNSPYALMFASYVAGLEKGLELANAVEKVCKERDEHKE